MIIKMAPISPFGNKTVITVCCSLGTCLVTWAAWRYFTRKKRNYKAHVNSREIFIVNNSEEWEKINILLMQDLKNVKVLGLDCEWVLKHKVSLLQLASPTKICVLVRLFKMNFSFPNSLKSLLADRSILKVGVAVLDDSKKLNQDYGLKVSGCVDLRHILGRVRAVFLCPSKGLQGLAKGILDVDINKSFKIRCGNWEAEDYTEEQIIYAATDAAVAVDIFMKLVNTKRKSPNLASDVVTYSKIEEHMTSAAPNNCKPVTTMSSQEDTRDQIQAVEQDDSLMVELVEERLGQGNTFEKVALSLCQGLVDSEYATSRINKLQPNAQNQPNVHKQPKQKKESTNAYSTRRRPLWDNCRLEAPDGSVLCTCDNKKAQWYLEKELGEIVCNDPLTVRLHFEPANRPQSENNYYLQEKENVCVVCGYEKDYVRKFVIPFEYRKFFPVLLKDHSSHDILLLCTPCHKRSCDFDITLRQQLAQECNAPLESGPGAKMVLDHDLQKVRSAARALKVNRHSIPEARVNELEKVLTDFYGVDELTEALLEHAAAVDARQTVTDFVPHGRRVVEHMLQNAGLLAFQARWRQHFLDTMRPQFLPPFWSVDYVPDGWTQRQSS